MERNRGHWSTAWRAAVGRQEVRGLSRQLAQDGELSSRCRDTGERTEKKTLTKGSGREH